MTTEADKKIAQDIVGEWGYEEPYWWEPIAKALATARVETWAKAVVEARYALTRVGLSRNCYDNPDEAEGTARYVVNAIEAAATAKEGNHQ